MIIENLSLEQFKEKLDSKKGTFFLKFSAEWCGPCKVFTPEVEKVSEEFSEIEFYSVDVEKNQQLAQMMNIRALPTSIIFKDGVVAKQIVGLLPAKELKATLETYK